MTTTLRPTEPLQRDADGTRSRHYQVCVNSRPVGELRLGTHPVYGEGVARIRDLRIDEEDRGRGRGTVAALAAEEVARGWGCGRMEVSIPAPAERALALATALGYVERNRNMEKELPAEPPTLPAGSAGRRMTGPEFTAWETHTQAGYVRTLVERGVPEAQARSKAEADHAATLAEGLATRDAVLSVLETDGAVVGTLWVALRGESAYVYDVEVAAEHRGHGHGRSLMLLAEAESHAAGVARLGLNVFAGNIPAVRLYESLGYRATEFHLYKPLL
ncbi:GNAT family N-acetyltransferase [Streptomyces sp. NBC_01446]|uniref:GNAT family N-acetyltransferase n=1 Tax=Streptomyces sp. NBC_00119 TaxID=2975659 RepID=A0AAU1UEG4_9ACTN|nr:GNAT family N-acetyltransferase [Streptomyces sp. NBC_01446]MCX4646664.1 GNAT family N-acetyltransferase [Streptomyces sp. NBC_01446]